LSTIFWNFEEPSFEEETGVSRSWLSSQPALLEQSQQVLLPDVQTPSADIYALYPSIDRTPRRITAAIEHLQQSLGARIGF
jgi:LysR family transcriptional activator of dmlA